MARDPPRPEGTGRGRVQGQCRHHCGGPCHASCDAGNSAPGAPHAATAQGAALDPLAVPAAPRALALRIPAGKPARPPAGDLRCARVVDEGRLRGLSASPGRLWRARSDQTPGMAYGLRERANVCRGPEGVRSEARTRRPSRAHGRFGDPPARSRRLSACAPWRVLSGLRAYDQSPPPGEDAGTCRGGSRRYHRAWRGARLRLRRRSSQSRHRYKRRDRGRRGCRGLRCLVQAVGRKARKPCTARH